MKKVVIIIMVAVVGLMAYAQYTWAKYHERLAQPNEVELDAAELNFQVGPLQNGRWQVTDRALIISWCDYQLVEIPYRPGHEGRIIIQRSEFNRWYNASITPCSELPGAEPGN